MKDHIQKALSAKRESKYVEFKGELDFEEPHTWCEIIKDIVAMANSGGGILVVGLDNNGEPTISDLTSVLEMDPATVTDHIYKYTGVHFSGFDISEQKKGGYSLAAILVSSTSVPLVFTKPGTYPVSDRKQKTAFSAGTVYFRHCAKSEPGNTDDIRKVIERELETIRQSWVKGVRKVMKAPVGSQVYTFAAGVEVRESASAEARAIRIVDDPDAPAYRKLDYDITHPFRQTEVIEEVNRALTGKAEVNSFDIQCIKRVYEIDEKDNFYHCPRFSLSPQYSREFVNWVIGQYQQDNEFFQKTRETDYEQKH